MGNRNILKEPDICSALGQKFTLTASQTSWEQCLLKIPSGKLHHHEGERTKKNGYFEIYKEHILHSAAKNDGRWQCYTPSCLEPVWTTQVVM